VNVRAQQVSIERIKRWEGRGYQLSYRSVLPGVRDLVTNNGSIQWLVFRSRRTGPQKNIWESWPAANGGATTDSRHVPDSREKREEGLLSCRSMKK
jgi:hypothetical protein